MRAVITADSDLVPDDDEWHYREAWIDAFRRRGIYPHDVSTFSEDALLWNAYRGNIRIVPEGAPAQPPFIEDPVRQARALGEIVADERYREEFGLAVGSDRLDDDKIDVPCVESVRTSRRVGPQGQLCYFVIAEITQRRAARRSNGVIMPYYGGATVILGPRGNILYVIAKSVLSESRLAIQRDYAASNAGRRFWQVVDGVYRPRPLIFSILHEDEPENGAVAKEAKTGERPTDEARNVAAKIPPEVTHRGLQTMSGRTKVFVSYSHKDHIWLKHLTTAIAPLASKDDIDAWSDNRIRAGQNWREEIKAAIESARVAILLVSQSFLASDFIQKHEVTPLLEAAEQSGLKLLSIAITSSLYEVTALEKYQWLNDPERPLDSMKAPVRNRQLVDIAKQIGQAVSSTALIASGAPS